MPGTEERLQRTAKAAIRLLKTRIRHYVFVMKRVEEHADRSRWDAMLLLEESFAKAAQREWWDALTLWDVESLQDQRTLRLLLTENFAESASEVLSAYDADQRQDLRRLIEEYHRNLPVDSFLREEAS